MKFLVVDDSPAIRRLVIACLKNLGYSDLYEAEDGKQALEITTRIKIDIILVNWIMPILSGMELAKAVRRNIEFKNIPIVMITTKSEKKDLIEAINNKINVFIVKPFTYKILASKLSPILQTNKKNHIDENLYDKVSTNMLAQSGILKDIKTIGTKRYVDNVFDSSSSQIYLDYSNNFCSDNSKNFNLNFNNSDFSLNPYLLDKKESLLDQEISNHSKHFINKYN